MTVVFLITIAVMWSLVAIAALKRRGTLDTHDPIDVGGGHRWITIGGLGIPFVVLTVFFVIGLRLMASFPIHAPMNERYLKPDIIVVGHQWWWEVHYVKGPSSERFTTANEIHIPVGKPITIGLRSADVIHAFWIPSLHGKVDMIPGHTNYIRIEASRAGEYPGQCAEYCGVEHALMRLLVVAQPPKAYEAWKENMLKPGAQPKTPDAIAGKSIFLHAPCADCHTIRGTMARGDVGPDLTHLASRKEIASDSYPNDTAYLEAWITHAQSLKPGAKMPNMTLFSGVQLRDLVAYLQQLK